MRFWKKSLEIRHRPRHNQFYFYVWSMSICIAFVGISGCFEDAYILHDITIQTLSPEQIPLYLSLNQGSLENLTSSSNITMLLQVTPGNISQWCQMQFENNTLKSSSVLKLKIKNPNEKIVYKFRFSMNINATDPEISKLTLIGSDNTVTGTFQICVIEGGGRRIRCTVDNASYARIDSSHQVEPIIYIDVWSSTDEIGLKFRLNMST